MAWNDIEAHKDPDLSIQVYYARINALQSLLSTLSRDVFVNLWELYSGNHLSGLRRSMLAGLVVGDIIRALGIRDLSITIPQIGDWFIHCGTTHYSASDGAIKTARIMLADKRIISGVVRRDCEITATASANMLADDDVSLVVGRRISSEKFDLIAAGFRDPMASLMQRSQREIDFGALPTSAIDNIAYSSLDGRLPLLQFDGWSDDYTLRMAVADAVTRFKHSIHNEGGWKHLYNHPLSAAHESRHQGLFRLFSRITFAALGIHVHPGADHGSGPTDLTLTLRDETHVIEFKKDHSVQGITHGLTVQLPRYMKSAGTVSGTYLVMCHERDPAEVKKIIADAKSHMPFDCILDVDAIDCRPRQSASKAMPLDI